MQARETLTYAEAQRLVEVDIEGRLHRINIYEPLEIINQDEIDNQNNVEIEEEAEKSPQKPVKNADVVQKIRKETTGAASHPTPKLPEAMYKVVEDYIRPNHIKPIPTSYYRYIEKSNDELDDEIEYDMDEEVGLSD